MPRLGFVGSTSYPIQSSDLQGNAIQIIANNLTVDLKPFFEQSPTMVALRKTTAFQDVIRWDVTVGDGSTSDAMATSPVLYSNFPGSDNGTYQQQSRIPAELTIGGYKTYNLVKFTHDELALAANRGIQAVRDLADNRIRFAVSQILRSLNAKLFTGTSAGNGNMIGFETIFSGTSYAGIPHALTDYTGSTPNEDYFPAWRPLSGLGDLSSATVTLNDGYGTGGTLVADTVYSVKTKEATGSLVVDHFYAFDYLMRIKGRRYNLIVAHPEIVEQFSHDYRNNLTYNISNGEIVQVNEGIAVPRFKGRPVIEDVMVPAGTCYFLNTNDMEVQTLSLGNSRNDNQNVVPQLNIMAGKLAADTAMTQRYEILTLPQLVVWDTRGLNRLKIQA